MEHLYPRTCYPLFTPLSAYIYDASRNQFVPVSKSLFFELVRAHNCQTLQNREEFEALLEEGFLAPHTIKSVVHPFTKYIDLMLGRTMSQILLQVTQDCNFRCEYCVYTASIDGVQRKHQNKHMSWDTAKRAVDYLWEHSIDSDVITIGFYGGEPLLEYSLIQKVISYSDKRFAGKQIH